MIKDKIKNIILENTEEKSFGCIHCKEDSALAVNDITLLVDDLSKLFPDKMKLAIAIVNFINKEYHLNLYTVDCAAMTDDIYALL